MYTALLGATAGCDPEELPPGTGGGAGSSGSATASTATETGTGTGYACGGPTGLPCGPDEYCDLPDNGACGKAGLAGICQERPASCPDDCPGACGCDGKMYCNPCEAHAAGFEIDAAGSCMP